MVLPHPGAKDIGSSKGLNSPSHGLHPTGGSSRVFRMFVWLGVDVFYLCRWMRESGLADLLPSLREKVFVGVSAGSMITAPIFGETYDKPFVIDKALGPVDFALLPHLDQE